MTNHTQCNGDGQANRISMNTNGDATMSNSSADETWIHELFQGTLVSTTKCLNCETVCQTEIIRLRRKFMTFDFRSAVKMRIFLIYQLMSKKIHR